MTRPISILLIDNSAITSIRLVELLQHTKGVDKVFYAKDIRKGCAMFAVEAIDVLILAIHVVNDELVRLCDLCKIFRCHVILLSEYTHSSYTSWCKSVGIAYSLDKASEVDQVKSILEQLVIE